MSSQMRLPQWLGLVGGFLIVFDLTLGAPLPSDSPPSNLQTRVPAPVFGCPGPAQDRGPKACRPFSNATASTDAHTPQTLTRSGASTSLQVKRAGDLSPAFFYDRPNRLRGTKAHPPAIRRRCLPPRYVYNIIPTNNFPGINAIDFPSWRDYATLAEAHKAILARQDSCRCKCDDFGRLITDQRYGGCKHQWQVDRCVVMFGCICIADLGQPTATDPGLTADDYQRAIEAIPRTVKELNPHWQWNMAGLDTEPGQTLKWASIRSAVNNPSLKEPYYLEGPSKNTDSDWNWLLNLNAGSGGALAGRLGGSLFRRNNGASDPTKTRLTYVPVVGHNITAT
ncbi:hypothetical protein Dda_6800 [Drechslerella dactyloides]|uniref:Uncharacterized protein n=1 Tax=Drechslerella dactyloides TaxID=74499 RepID=A0AAD6IYH3_DREDA|nr:hypothetical protein Dda_6800 [Drechslerella dactyloides]